MPMITIVILVKSSQLESSQVKSSRLKPSQTKLRQVKMTQVNTILHLRYLEYLCLLLSPEALSHTLHGHDKQPRTKV